MKAGAELMAALTVLPGYDPSICEESKASRLAALSSIYQIYLPSQMSVEIYSKLYLALLHSLQKKTTKQTIQQQYENYHAIRQRNYTGILGGSDSFTIIGTSGIGKSSAINRAIDLIAASGIIEVKEPYPKIIPCIVVQCPYDCSVKGLLLEILRNVDECLNSKYYENALRIRATTDTLIGNVSQVALNHIGLLVVDEIQNVCNSRHGKSLVGMLTQLINNSGISICMVGTPESSAFFEQAMQLARRSLGLWYNAVDYNTYFCDFCRTLFRYRFVKYDAEITEGITAWLYEHSAGIISVVVSLVHDAQEIAILSGKETLNLETLNEAFQKRLSLLHNWIAPPNKTHNPKQTPKALSMDVVAEVIENQNLLSDLAAKAKREQINIVTLLREHIAVVEISI